MRKIIILFLLVAFPVLARAPECPQNTQIAVLNENTLKPISSISYEPEDIWEGVLYRSLIRCLAYYESGFNPNAIGKAGERGILQFMKGTFAAYCEGTWENPRDQITCCDQMLQTDFGLITHWTTHKFCY